MKWDKWFKQFRGNLKWRFFKVIYIYIGNSCKKKKLIQVKTHYLRFMLNGFFDFLSSRKPNSLSRSYCTNIFKHCENSQKHEHVRKNILINGKIIILVSNAALRNKKLYTDSPYFSTPLNNKILQTFQIQFLPPGYSKTFSKLLKIVRQT